jgi:two-component system NtrC family sensor kinase
MRKFSKQPKPQFTEVRLHTVLDRSLLLIHHLLEEKKIKLARSFAAKNDAVAGDPDQLEQAFINLFFNALDAMKPHGRLAVSTETVSAGAKGERLPDEKPGPGIRVTIEDNGAGIAPENMDRLFEAFFTTKPEGTGLGLAITRRILHEHEGTIAARSELDKGTTFTLVLPTNGTVG